MDRHWWQCDLVEAAVKVAEFLWVSVLIVLPGKSRQEHSTWRRLFFHVVPSRDPVSVIVLDGTGRLVFIGGCGRELATF